MTASEAREGEVLLIDTQTKRVQIISGLAGGVMSLIPIPEDEGAFLAIQKFYPVFDSAAAEIVYCKLQHTDEAVLKAEVRVVACVPYVHRIALTGCAGARKLLAANLCNSKAFQDDWSQPGEVKEFTLNNAFEVTDCRIVVDGIHKNHGMYLHHSQVLVSGEEGIWSIDAAGAAEKICDSAVSDLCLFDIDGDGIEEIICIAPFHGNAVQVLKRNAAGWEIMHEETVNFGHAIWCGMLGDTPAILSCSRGGDRATWLYRLLETGKYERILIEGNVGAANITVAEDGEQIVLYAANHGENETARYTISA